MKTIVSVLRLPDRPELINRVVDRRNQNISPEALIRQNCLVSLWFLAGLMTFEHRDIDIDADSPFDAMVEELSIEERLK